VIREVLDRFTSSDTADDETDGEVYGGIEQDLDDVYDILTNERRRWVLQYLENANSPVSLRELSKQRAAVENDCEPRELSSDQYKQVYVGLYQTHIPALEDADLVHNDGGGMITPADEVSVLVTAHGLLEDLVNGGDS
jgi:hypothetical protein